MRKVVFLTIFTFLGLFFGAHFSLADSIAAPIVTGYGGQFAANNFVPGNTVEQGGFLNLYGVFPHAGNQVYINHVEYIPVFEQVNSNKDQLNIKLENTFPIGLSFVTVRDTITGLSSVSPMAIYVFPATTPQAPAAASVVVSVSDNGTAQELGQNIIGGTHSLTPGVFDISTNGLNFNALVRGNNTFLAQFFGIGGKAGDTFVVTATPDWLSVTPASGIFHQTISTEQVVVNANGFSKGLYGGTVKVSATGPDCSGLSCSGTVNVLVNVGVVPTPPTKVPTIPPSGTVLLSNNISSTSSTGIPSTAPTLILPTGPTINFTGSGSQTIIIKGSPSSHYNIGATSDGKWLSDKVTANSLLGSYYGNGTIVVTADTTGLTAKSTHTGTITVNSSDGTSQSVAVTLVVSTPGGSGSNPAINSPTGTVGTGSGEVSTNSGNSSSYSVLTGNGTNPISIAMTSPSASTLKAGSSQNITWFYYQGAGTHINYTPTNLTVQLFDGTTYQITRIATLGSSTTTSTSWTVPSNLSSTDKYLLQVCDDNIGCAGGDAFTFVP